jgi:uncharacterized protein (UPF0210 family)
MGNNKSIQNLLEVTLNAEMTIRSITTKVQKIREAHAEYEFYKKMLNEQMLENYYAEKKNIQVDASNLKREEELGAVVSALKYLIVSKHGDDAQKIEEARGTLN